MDRRTFLTRGAGVTAGVTAGMWAAPVIQTAGISAAAGTPLSRTCTGQAYDFKAVFTGPQPLNGFVGPAKASSLDIDTNCSPIQLKTPCDCLGEQTVELPPPFTALLTLNGAAGEDCVENDFDGAECRTLFALLGDPATVSIDPVGALPPIQAEVAAINSFATAECGVTPSGQSVLAAGKITIDGNPFPFAANPPANTNLVSPQLAALLATLGLTGTITLNEQKPIPNGFEVNAIHIFLKHTATTQTVDVKIGHAHADVHNCPPPA